MANGLLSPKQLYRDSAEVFEEVTRPVVGPMNLAQTQATQLQHMRPEGGAPSIAPVGGVLYGRNLAGRAAQQARSGAAYAGDMARLAMEDEFALRAAKNQLARQLDQGRAQYEAARARTAGQVARLIGATGMQAAQGIRRQQALGRDRKKEQWYANYNLAIEGGVSPQAAALQATEIVGFDPRTD